MIYLLPLLHTLTMEHSTDDLPITSAPVGMSTVKVLNTARPFSSIMITSRSHAGRISALILHTLLSSTTFAPLDCYARPLLLFKSLVSLKINICCYCV
ncbi:hypothetical protein MHYP_G00084920 [Metynnis hypsauchen]